MNSHVAAFIASAKQELAPYLDCTGLCIYSAAESVRENNPVAYWGFNPGQDPTVEDCTHWTIEEFLDKFPEQHLSLIDNQEWPNARRGTKAGTNGRKEFAGHHPVGRSPYQKGVRHLLEQIGCADAVVTNFLFLQSSKANAFKFGDPKTKSLVEKCWRVHKSIFRITNPRVIITTAGVVEYLKYYRLMELVKECEMDSGYSNWKCVLYRSTMGCVIQAPHMSYWGGCITNSGSKVAIRSNAAVRWIVEKAKASIA